MRVLSLNAWGGRIGGLLEYLSSADADIYCLQEIYDSPNEGTYSDAAGLVRDGKPLVHARLFEELKRALPGHTGHFFPATAWELRDIPKEEIVPCQFGIATFIRKGTVVEASETKFVYQDYRHVPQVEAPTPRLAHAVRLLYKKGPPVVVAHMHGLWIPEGKHDTPARIEQAHKLLRLLEDVAEVGDSVVLCGDFNVLPGSQTFKVLQGLSDLVVGGGHNSTRTPLYYNDPKKKGEPLFADYMLVSPGVKVKKFEVVRNPVVSDHCPLVLDITW